MIEGLKLKKKGKIFNFVSICNIERKEIYIWIWKEYENSM